MHPAPLPEWLQERHVRDRLFLQAYDRVPDRRRAQLKSCIARLHALLGQNAARFHARTVGHGLGFVAHTQSRPVSWCVILLGDMRSPLRVLAAALPPLLAGVEHIVVARLGPSRRRAPWPDAVLAGLELAGLETVADLANRSAAMLFRELIASGSSGVVLLPDAADAQLPAEARLQLGAAPNVRFWRPRPVREMGVYCAPEAHWDLDLLHWAHPDVACCLWNTDAVLPQEWRRLQGSIAQFLAQGYDYMFLPRAESASDMPGELLLEPGFEGFWFWPGLQPGVFMRDTAVWCAPRFHREE